MKQIAAPSANSAAETDRNAAYADWVRHWRERAFDSFAKRKGAPEFPGTPSPYEDRAI